MWEHNFENKKLIWRAVQTAEKTEKKRRSNVKQVYIDSLKRLLANQNGFFLLPLLQRIFNQFQSLDLYQRIISTKNECRKYCFSVFFSICPIWWRFAYCGTLVFFSLSKFTYPPHTNSNRCDENQFGLHVTHRHLRALPPYAIAYLFSANGAKSF